MTYKPKKHVVYTLKCQRCLSEFTAGKKNAKYCGSRCNFAAWYAVNPRKGRTHQGLLSFMRSHTEKCAHFEDLKLFPSMESNEFKFTVKLANGTTYNPDYFDPGTDTYLEVVTSPSNISQQRDKWTEALTLIRLRIFWWTGEEITDLFR